MDERPLGLMIWLRMAKFVHRSNCISNEYLTQSGLTVAQFEVLDHVRAQQPVNQSDLADALTISGGGISRMLSTLESRALITRTQDRKFKFISLTAAGEELLARVYPGQVELQTSMFDDVLDPDEQQQLFAFMRRLHRNSLTKQAPATAAMTTETKK